MQKTAGRQNAELEAVIERDRAKKEFFEFVTEGSTDFRDAIIRKFLMERNRDVDLYVKKV